MQGSDEGWEIGDEPDNSRFVFKSRRGVTGDGYGDCVSLLREPDAANPHVRFDERGVGAAMLDGVPVVESTTGGIAQIPP